MGKKNNMVYSYDSLIIYSWSCILCFNGAEHSFAPAYPSLQWACLLPWESQGMVLGRRCEVHHYPQRRIVLQNGVNKAKRLCWGGVKHMPLLRRWVHLDYWPQVFRLSQTDRLILKPHQGANSAQWNLQSAVSPCRTRLTLSPAS